MALLEHEVDVNARFAAGRLVLFYADPREAREMGQRVFTLLQPWMDDPALTPHRLGRWLALWARCASDAKDRVQAERARAQALALVQRHRDKDTIFFLTVSEFDAAIHARDLPGMEAAVARAADAADPANLNDLGRVEWFRGRLALARRDGDAALFHAQAFAQVLRGIGDAGPDAGGARGARRPGAPARARLRRGARGLRADRRTGGSPAQGRDVRHDPHGRRVRSAGAAQAGGSRAPRPGLRRAAGAPILRFVRNERGLRRDDVRARARARRGDRVRAAHRRGASPRAAAGGGRQLAVGGDGPHARHVRARAATRGRSPCKARRRRSHSNC